VIGQVLRKVQSNWFSEQQLKFSLLLFFALFRYVVMIILAYCPDLIYYVC
jgi:hypothetical protein